MSRKLRIEYPGAMYHVINRGDQRENIMTLKWIAKRLHMSSWTYVSNLLSGQPQTHPQAQEELRLRQ